MTIPAPIITIDADYIRAELDEFPDIHKLTKGQAKTLAALTDEELLTALEMFMSDDVWDVLDDARRAAIAALAEQHAPKPSGTVHAVAFSPATEDGGVGGFIWSFDRDYVATKYVRYVRESAAAGGSHAVRLVALDVFSGIDCDDITAELEERSDELESTAPAVRQYIPAHTPREFLPTARRAER